MFDIPQFDFSGINTTNNINSINNSNNSSNVQYFTISGKRGTYYYLTPYIIQLLHNYPLYKRPEYNPWVQSIVTTDNNSWLIYSDLKTIFPEFQFNLSELLYGTYFEVTPPILGDKKQPRDIAFVSNESKGYQYSKNMIPSQPLNPHQKYLLDLVNFKFAPKNLDTSCSTKYDNDVVTHRKAMYNGILINFYENQNNSIGAHSDDETTLGPGGVISIIFGETRDFQIRNLTFPNEVIIDGVKKDFIVNNQKMPPIIHKIPIMSGTVLWMGGKFQQHFQHEIPKKINKTLGPRISFTFRSHLV
jgi:alkylated DNA repair dioxygenase AlkB